jgi:hypothetical protein
VSGVLKLGSTTFGTENNGKIDLTNVGPTQFSSSNHTWELKAVDAPIVGANYSTNDDPLSGQLAIYNGVTKLWGITEGGIVTNSLKPICMLYDYLDTILSVGVNVYPFNGRLIDTQNCYDVSDTNNPTFTAPIDGYYFISMNSRVYYDYNGRIVASAEINGSTRVVVYFDYFAGAAIQEFQEASGTAVVKMFAGDYLKLGVAADTSTNHLGYSTITTSETSTIDNSSSHANIIFLG